MARFVHPCQCFALPGRAAFLTEFPALRFRGIRDPELLGARVPDTWGPYWFPVAGAPGAAGARGTIGARGARAAPGMLGPPGCLLHLEPVWRM
eukprot:3277759-Pyramimonas_sp.AAC.1